MISFFETEVISSCCSTDSVSSPPALPPDHEDGDVYIEAGEFQPKAASDFSAAKDDNSAKFRGVGLLSHAVYFDPIGFLLFFTLRIAF